MGSLMSKIHDEEREAEELRGGGARWTWRSCDVIGRRTRS